MTVVRQENCDIALILTAIALILTAIAIAAPGLAAQERPPTWTRLPDDPRDFPRLVAAGEREASEMFRMGCPSDDGWAGAAFTALERAAENNFNVRRSLARALGSTLRLSEEDRTSEEVCPSDIQRFEIWLAERLRREWHDGLLAPGNERPALALGLLFSLTSSTNPSTHELFRGIATDSTVHEHTRNLAARFMVDHRFGASTIGKDLLGDPARRERYLDAYQSVLFDLATGPPLPEFETNAREIVGGRRGVEFEREYERVLREAGRIRR